MVHYVAVRSFIFSDSQGFAAFENWKPLAEQGDIRAQFCLGVLYINGFGVPKDYIQAHMWLNLAAASGSKVAAENRKMLIDELNAEQIDLAQKMSRDCKTKNYRGC